MVAKKYVLKVFFKAILKKKPLKEVDLDFLSFKLGILVLLKKKKRRVFCQ